MTHYLKFEITGYVFWLSSPVHSGSLKRIDYPKQLSGPPSFFGMSPLLLKELIIIFLLTYLLISWPHYFGPFGVVGRSEK